ncbi:MAG: type VI secretion system tip protein VgrG [Polyangiaceae bacterium]
MNNVELRVAFEDGVEAPALEILELRGHERVGQPYRFEVVVRAPASELAPGLADAWMNASVQLELAWTAAGERAHRRTLYAMVDAIDDRMEVASNGTRTFALLLRPKFAELDRFITQDIFVGATIPAVVRAKLALAQFPEAQYVMRLADEAAYLDHDGADADLVEGRLVVQYRESDLAFISRLCEHVGISFFLQEGVDGDEVVFTDHDGGFTPRDAPLVFGGDGSSRGLLSLQRRLRGVKSQFFTYDYNYRTPHLTYQRDGAVLFDVLGGEAQLEVPSSGALLEYAPNVKTPDEARFIAERRAEEEEAKRERFVGTCIDPTVSAGQRLHVSGHPELDDDVELLVVGVEHTFATPTTALASGAAHAQPQYRAQLDMVRLFKKSPNGQPLSFRPERATPKPKIAGVVTGIIQSTTAEQGEGRQHIDAQGRYLVKLHFDQGPKTMPRLRMAQPSGGAGYGHHFPLRPGAEVLVGFLDGDPDRPVILGAVPNPLQRSPVTVPLEHEPPEVNRIKTISGVVFEIGDGLSRDSH